MENSEIEVGSKSVTDSILEKFYGKLIWQFRKTEPQLELKAIVSEKIKTLVLAVRDKAIADGETRVERIHREYDNYITKPEATTANRWRFLIFGKLK